MSMYVCPKCGKKVWSEASQCMFCGTSIEDIIYYHKTGEMPTETPSVSETKEPSTQWMDPRTPLINEYKKQMISSIILSLQHRSRIVLPKPTPTPTEQPKPQPKPQPQRRTTVKPNNVKPDYVKPKPTIESPTLYMTNRTKRLFKTAFIIIGAIVLFIISSFVYFVIQAFGSLSHSTSHDEFEFSGDDIIATYHHQMYKIPNPKDKENNDDRMYKWSKNTLFLGNDYHYKVFYTLSSTEQLGFDERGFYYLTVVQDINDPNETYITFTKRPNYNHSTGSTMGYVSPYNEQDFDIKLDVMDYMGNIHVFKTKPTHDKGAARIEGSKNFLKLIEDNKYLLVFMNNNKDKRSHCFLIYHLNGEHDDIIDQFFYN